jgi:acyl-homoserine lactone acylase PvdQ
MMVVLFIFPNFKNLLKTDFMKHLRYSFSVLLCLLIAFTSVAQKAKTSITQNSSASEKERWEKHVANTNIIRDEWGIPHIYGKTDADAVFGLMYAQCEENFPQIEKNYLEMLGRSSEVANNWTSQMQGDPYADLMMKLIQDSAAAMLDFNNSPDWFKKLLIAHADGLNYYLKMHPDVQPKIITHYEPWFHLMWTDGSVSPTRYGGIRRKDVFDFYKIQDSILKTVTGENVAAQVSNTFNVSDSRSIAWANIDDYAVEEKTLKGSNGFAIAPNHSKNGNAMLYINPHVPFYFRSEMHMVSEEGLNVYGAVTWGQMFIYQGFNERAGWMHTSSYADVADVYVETVKQENGKWFYLFDNKWLPIKERKITSGLPVKTFTTYQTHHGPIMGSKDGKWLSLRENNRSLNALLECWTRTKATNLKEYKTALNLLANNSNNTVYADADGNIAYWHGNFMPKRNNDFDFTRPVDGSIKATDWQGMHSLNEIVQSINPENGWLQNCNATPFTVAGKNSPKESNYPKYMAPDGENPRGLNAVRLLEKIDKISLDDLIELGYNKHLTAFDILLPPFIAYSKTVSLNKDQEKAIQYLASWNHDADTNSIAQTIAIEWASKLMTAIPPAATEEAATQSIFRFNQMIQEVPNEKKLAYLDTALLRIKLNYSNLPINEAIWEIPWGQINRYQRALANSEFPFSDKRASISVGQTSSKYGQLPAFESSVRNSGLKKRYGFSGSSFIAAVSFGKKLEAKTIITGGQSFDSNSPHFTDQAQDFIDGKFKTIHFYKEDVLAHKVISYKPGLER